jgi:RecA-family ATPase
MNDAPRHHPDISAQQEQWFREIREEENRRGRPNGQWKADEPPPVDPLLSIDLVTLVNLPLEPPVFLDSHGFILMDAVHVLNGDGGAGKTDLMCQLAIACRTDTPFLGLPVKQGPVVFYSAEEPTEKLLWRIHTICADKGIDPEIAMSGLHVIDRARKAAWLFDQNSKKRLVLTPHWFELKAMIERIRPIVFMVDNRMRVLAGDQNDTVMAVDVITALDSLSYENQCAGILGSHPSLSQMSSGRGDAGSVSWGNAGRGRSLLGHPDKDREFGAEDDGKRVLTNLKANYGKPGASIEFQWKNGYFNCTYKPPRADEGIGAQSKAERVFMTLMRWHADQGIDLSASPGSASYPPKLFNGLPSQRREGLNSRWFKDAMLSLFDQQKIKTVDGRSNGHATKFVVVSH